MAIQPIREQKAQICTDTSNYNKWYRTWKVCSIVANNTMTVLKATSVAAAVGASWCVGGFWLSAPVGGTTLYQLFGKKTVRRDSHELIDLVMQSLDSLSHRIPPKESSCRAPATMQELLSKDANTYTRDDYCYLIEHVLMESKTLFDWYSVTGAHRKPFEDLLNALNTDSDLNIPKALNATLAKLIELRQSRAGCQTEAYKTALLHPRLKELAESLILMKKSLLSNSRLNEQDRQKCLKALTCDKETLSLMTKLVDQEATNACDNLNNLLIKLNASHPYRKELNAALETIKGCLPNKNPLYSEISFCLSQEPLVIQALRKEPSSVDVLYDLEKLVNREGFIEKKALFQLIKSVELCHHLPHLEEIFRYRLKDYYRTIIERNYPLHPPEALDSERPFNDFLHDRAEFPSLIIQPLLLFALTCSVWHPPFLTIPQRIIEENDFNSSLRNIINFILNRRV